MPNWVPWPRTFTEPSSTDTVPFAWYARSSAPTATECASHLGPCHRDTMEGAPEIKAFSTLHAGREAPENPPADDPNSSWPAIKAHLLVYEGLCDHEGDLPGAVGQKHEAINKPRRDGG